MTDRICITGLGIVSALGENKYETVDQLLSEQSGIGKMLFLDTVHKEIPVGMVKKSDYKLK
jgi:3-oxoacyl-(acyl-carrier-protein) synthase